jgi:hypothetical protein
MGINIVNGSLVTANARARFYANTTQPVAGHTVVDFAADDYNDGEGFTRINGNSWTVNFTGKVRVSSQVYNSGTTTPAAARLNVRVNGTEQSTGTGGWSQNGISMSQTINVTAGDTLDMYLLSNAGQTIQSGIDATFVTFDRLADYTAGEPTGFGVATETNYGLVKAPSVVTGSAYSTVDLVAGAANISSMTLTPGKWIVYGAFLAIKGGGSGTSEMFIQHGISNVSANFEDPEFSVTYHATSGFAQPRLENTRILNVSTTTTYYLVASYVSLASGLSSLTVQANDGSAFQAIRIGD